MSTGNLGVKCVRALGRIDSEDAVEALREAAATGSTRISGAAATQLRRAGSDRRPGDAGEAR
jgi:hypothetical protein